MDNNNFKNEDLLTRRDRSEDRPSNCWVYYYTVLFGIDAEMSHSPGSFSLAKKNKSEKSYFNYKEIKFYSFRSPWKSVAAADCVTVGNCWLNGAIRWL